jgi:Ca2+-binding EF-hand superfamily protein/thiol-disulfide isomerase/thioredoxin
MDANPDQLVVLKFFAPWCRACKGLEPKFLQIANDEKYQDLPIMWADLSIQHNKDFVKSLGVLALPSVQFYANGGLVESFPCGPSKVPILKRKLAQFIDERVDLETKQIKQVSTEEGGETEPCTSRSISDEVGGNTTELSVAGVAVSKKQWNMMRNEVPYFTDFTEEEFQQLMSKAKLLTFEPGAVIMREGKKGRTFYVIESGEVEVFVKTAFEDPLTTPPSYLGTMVNQLGQNDYFGERTLITGERRAASIRATNKTRCFAFDIDDIPASSILSGKKQASTERIQQLNDKYGVDVYDIDFILGQFRDANMGNQVRGSPNSPRPIKGVDTDETLNEEEETPELESVQDKLDAQDLIIPLLVRFKLIRHAARCFNYIVKTQPKWGDSGELRRRSMLVSKLTPAQREEFTDVFKVIDSSGDGLIELIELKRVMESIGEEKTDEEILDMINKGNVAMDGNQVITYQDFMGVMVTEAEFYHLFKDTFAALDKHNSGYIKASDVDRVLCGMRDLICDDHKSIIDVDDMDMQIDYEQFSKMLLGIALS